MLLTYFPHSSIKSTFIKKIIKAIFYLLSVYVFCSSVFAIKVVVIEDPSERQQIFTRLGALKSTEDKDKVILQVQIDGLAYNKYSSGSIKSGINKEAIYVDSYKGNEHTVEAYAQELRKRGFPHESISLLIILEHGFPRAPDDMIQKLKQAHDLVIKQSEELKRQEQEGIFDVRDVITVYTDTRKATDEKLQRYVQERYKPQYDLWIRAAQSYRGEEGTLTKPAQEAVSQIEALDNSVYKAVSFPKLRPIASEDEAVKVKLELFCNQWGSHAEDAFIRKLLYDVKSNNFSRVPRTIDIYGTKDPCFQCQVKLQWLANALKKEFSQLLSLTDQKNYNLVIRYFSKDSFTTQCAIPGVLPHDRMYCTRPSHEQKLDGTDRALVKLFIFDAGDQSYKPEVHLL